MSGPLETASPLTPAKGLRGEELSEPERLVAFVVLLSQHATASNNAAEPRRVTIAF
jgi:hypothetical protein